MTTNIKLTRVTTLEKSNKTIPALPHRAIRESSYITEDFRFVVYKIENTLWGWGSLKPQEDYINNLRNFNHHANTKEGVVRNLESFIADEKADSELWTA
jgi:hypothetical protein